MIAASTAGGAQVDQLVALGVVYLGGTGAVVWLAHAHRTGRTKVLESAGNAAAFVLRVPGWAALPVVIATVGLLAAMWGGLWDIGYHVDNGRDTGPLGNPGHWPLLLGIFTTFAAGVIAFGMADQEDATPAWVRITEGWHVPIGAVLLVVCMSFGLSALALDDVWHRIFGQDVTLWSPTHFVFLFGGMLTVTGMLVLLKEGSIARVSQNTRFRDAGRPAWPELAWRRLLRVALLGGLLCGLELYLAEYDWGVPLYRQVWQPLLLAAFAGLIFTAARAWAGPGSALGAWGVYAVIRATGIVVPVIAGVSAPSMPLLLGSAVCVELLALRLDPRRRALAFGAGAGLLCGTVGFAAEYGWSQIAMPLPWTDALLPEGLIYAAVAGVAGGLLGALFAAAMRGELPRPRVARDRLRRGVRAAPRRVRRRGRPRCARRPRPDRAHGRASPRPTARRSRRSGSTRRTRPTTRTGSTSSRGPAVMTAWSTGSSASGPASTARPSRSRSAAGGRSACD